MEFLIIKKIKGLEKNYVFAVVQIMNGSTKRTDLYVNEGVISQTIK